MRRAQFVRGGRRPFCRLSFVRGGGQQPPRRLSFAWNHILPSKAAGEGSAATGMAAADLAMENGGRRQWGACLGLAAQHAGLGALELVLRRWPA